MKHQVHPSRRHLLDISFDGCRDAEQLQNELSRVYRQRLVPMLDEVMTDLVGPEETLVVDRLVLQTPPVHPDALETDWVDAVRRELIERLQELLARRPPVHSPVEPSSARHLRYLEHFLRRGYAPWWRPGGEAADFERFFLELLREEPGRVAAVIRDVGREARARRRLARQLSQGTRLDLLRRLDSEAAASARAVLFEDASPKGLARRSSERDAAFEERVWEEALALAIEPRARRWTSAQFASALRRHLSDSGTGQPPGAARRGQAIPPASAPSVAIEPSEPDRPPVDPSAVIEGDGSRRARLEADLYSLRRLLVQGDRPGSDSPTDLKRLFALISRLRRSAPTRLADVLREAAREPTALDRLASLPAPMLPGLLEVLAPGRVPRLLELVDELAPPSPPTEAGDAERRLRRAAWRLVLGRLLDSGEAAAEDSPSRPPAAARPEARELAASDATSELLARLPEAFARWAYTPETAERAAQVRRLSDALRSLAAETPAVDWRLFALEALVGPLVEPNVAALPELIASVVERIARRSGTTPEPVAARLRRALEESACESATERPAAEPSVADLRADLEPQEGEPAPELLAQIHLLMKTLQRLAPRADPAPLESAVEALIAQLSASAPMAPGRRLADVVEGIARRSAIPVEPLAARLLEAAPAAPVGSVSARFVGHLRQLATADRPAKRLPPAARRQPGETAKAELGQGAEPRQAPIEGLAGAEPEASASNPIEPSAATEPTSPVESSPPRPTRSDEDAALVAWLDAAWPADTPGAAFPRRLRQALARDPAGVARRLRAHPRLDHALRRLARHLDAELLDRLATALRPDSPVRLSRMLGALLVAMPTVSPLSAPSTSAWRPVIVTALLRPLIENPDLPAEELAAAIASELVAAGRPLETRSAPVVDAAGLDHGAPTTEDAPPPAGLEALLDEIARGRLAVPDPATRVDGPESPTVDRERPPKPSPEPRDEEPVETFINNAGLVLLHPFLRRFFELTALLDEDRFLDDDAAERAVHLSQSLVGDPGPVEEPSLALNKLLCGLPLEFPVRRSIEVTEHERALGRSLLEHAIQAWPKIQNTSVEGFQASFLVRRGRLAEEPEHWRLHVEAKGFDMLLDTLPWSISVVRTAWMSKPILVDWR